MSTAIITEIEKLHGNTTEQFSQGTEWQDDLDDLLTKCGEVFMQHRQQQEIFVIGCTLCDAKYLTLDSFTQHIKDEHLIEESSELWDEEEKELIEWDANEDDIEDDQEECVDEESNSTSPEIQKKEENAECAVVEQIFIKENPTDLVADSESTLLELELEAATAADNAEEEKEEEEDEEEEGAENIAAENIKSEAESTLEDECTDDAASEQRERKKYKKKTYTCDDCGVVFQKLRERRQHRCTSWEPDNYIHQCNKCGKCFNRKSNLKTHELIHKTVRPFPCEICGASFANKQNFTIHLRRHSGEKPFKCVYCEKAFVSSTERHTHERKHTGARPYVCEICGRDFSTSSRLLEHVNRHADVRKFACTKCDKKFRTGTHLRSHYAVVHTELPRIFDCPHCTASFKTIQSLRQHSKIHTAQKSYKCKVCSKEFAQHAGIYAHMKTHNKS